MSFQRRMKSQMKSRTRTSESSFGFHPALKFLHPPFSLLFEGPSFNFLFNSFFIKSCIFQSLMEIFSLHLTFCNSHYNFV